jgi:tetratricopeptide (TPR) repeat protein
VYRQEGRLPEAEPMAREALGIRQKLFGNESLEVADSRRNLSIILGDESKWAESEAMAREVLATRRKLLGPEHPWVASALTDVAWAAGAQGKSDEAEMLEQESLAMRLKLLGGEHPDLAKSFYLVGDSMRRRGDLNEADSYLNKALSIQRKGLDKDNPDLLATLNSLGLTLEAEGKWPEAETVRREALDYWRKRAGNEDPQTLSELEGLTRVLVAQKKFGDAKQLLDEALTPAFVKQPSSADILILRVDLEARRGQWQEAADDAALAIEHDPFHDTWFPVLAALLVKTHNRSANEQFCQRLLTTFANTTNFYVADQVAKACLFVPPSEADLSVIGHLADTTVTQGTGDLGAMPFFQDCKALSEYRQRHYAEAVEWAQKPLTIPGNYVHGHAYAVLAMAYWRLGEKDEARAMLAKGDTLAPPIMPVSIAEDPSNAWLAWLYARIQLDEATALVDSPAAQGK